LATASTRQNSEVSSAVEEPGGVRWPAATLVEKVIVTSGRFTLVSSAFASAGTGP